ncbi:MAG: acyl-CoA thioesterase [Pseudomonadota bacterium]
MIELPQGHEPVMRLIPVPSDANFYGDIFGGWVMSQLDLAGYAIAVRRAKGRLVTVGIESIRFMHPIKVGDIVSLYGTIVHIGSTSITVEVDVFVERSPLYEEILRVTEARLTYVALDENGNKRLIV